MKIKELKTRQPYIHELVEVWEDSVKATHLFLSSKDISNIKAYVPMALENVKHLIVVFDQSKVVGFMGIDHQKIEMLFIHSQYRGRGIGKQLIHYGFLHHDVNTVCVNEQNPLAVEFYKHMGFHVYHRSEKDEQGQDFPILFMKCKRNDKEKLLERSHEIHTTPLGSERIKRNLHIKEDVVCYCLKKIKDSKSIVYKQGKNYYCECDGIKITINSYTMTIITAHLLK